MLSQPTAAAPGLSGTTLRPHFTAWTSPRRGLAGRLLARWTEGWKWYAAQGYTPPAGEAAYPLRRQVLPAPVQPRIALRACGCAPRFSLLFGHTAAGR
jgi:hypothetical protein